MGGPSVGTRFCGQCGAPIPAVPGPCPACGAVEWALPAQAARQRSDEAQQVYQTRLALLLLAVGVVASLLPVAAIVGDILVLTGGVLLILSSQPFGPAHRRDVVLGLALTFGGAVASGLAAVFFSLTAPAPPSAGSQVAAWAQALEANLSAALLVTMFLATVSALGLVLLTYALQDRTGRMCLWLAFLLGIAIDVALFVVVYQGLAALVSEAQAGGGLDYTLFAGIFSEIGWFAYLGILPNALFAGCYFLADTRIRRGVIPAAPATPSGG